jgi:hypothetical protein
MSLALGIEKKGIILLPLRRIVHEVSRKKGMIQRPCTTPFRKQRRMKMDSQWSQLYRTLPTGFQGWFLLYVGTKKKTWKRMERQS